MQITPPAAPASPRPLRSIPLSPSSRALDAAAQRAARESTTLHGARTDTIPGWEPHDLVTVRSARGPGLLEAALDAVAGHNETGTGQPLTAAQQETLAPFLATQWKLPADVVRADLDAVRLYLGGASDRKGVAVTIGTDLYVHDESDLRSIMRWDKRRWLAHELGHTMQWRRAGSGGDLERTRAFLRRYALGAASSLPEGVLAWIRARRQDQPESIPLADALHDAHPMEREADLSARAFLRATGA